MNYFSQKLTLKDSGITWIREIPKHWNVGILNNLVQIIVSNVDKKSHEAEIKVLLCNYTDVYYNRFINSTIDFMEASATKLEVEKFSLEINDVLITKDSETPDDIAVPCLLIEKIPNLLCGYHLSILRPLMDRLDGKYLLFSIISTSIKSQFSSLATGITRYGLSYKHIKSINLCIPPLEEQRAIASFLDRKTAAIDTLITKKQRLIQLLEEKRTALINQAVTKGLNSNIPMKDSELPWIGKIPKHWHIVKISLKSRILNGTTPDRTRLTYWEEGTIPWVCSGEVNEYIITKPTAFITEIALRECSLSIMPKQSVVIGMIGQGKTRGTSARLGINACINQNIACIIPSADLDSIYLHQALIQAYEPIRELARGGNQGALNCELVGSIKIPFPPIQEQRKIAVFIEGKYQVLEEIKKAINSQIQKLQEYRQSLITAAVTGKIDIREEIAA